MTEAAASIAKRVICPLDREVGRTLIGKRGGEKQCPAEGKHDGTKNMAPRPVSPSGLCERKWIVDKKGCADGSESCSCEDRQTVEPLGKNKRCAAKKSDESIPTN
jgi:hypothetical protein